VSLRRYLLRNHTTETEDTQIRARHPTTPPIIAPALLGLLVFVSLAFAGGGGCDVIVVEVSVPVAPVSFVSRLNVRVPVGDSVDAVGRAGVTMRGLDAGVVVKAKKLSVNDPPPQAM